MTNQSSWPREFLFERFNMLGLKGIELSQCYTAAYVTAEHLKNLTIGSDNKSIYVMGQIGLKKVLKESGFNVVNMDDNELDEDLIDKADFVRLAESQLDPTVFAVVTAIDVNITYRKLCLASLYVQKNKAVVLCCN